MKLIILEGGDQLGKSTIIEGLCRYLKYDNVCIRHFGKPPKNILSQEVSDFQFRMFDKEAELVNHFHQVMDGNNWMYYPSTIIWNRSHLGEYVYSQMFRGMDPILAKQRVLSFERGGRMLLHQTYLVTLTADPKFFYSKEDGQSFSQNLEQKTQEINLFEEIHGESLIFNKILIKVNDGNNYRSKDEILDLTINLINR